MALIRCVIEVLCTEFDGAAGKISEPGGPEVVSAGLCCFDFPDIVQIGSQHLFEQIS